MSPSAASDYGGLDLPQLLDLMHDPVIPDPVGWWPQTPGWWILLAWLAAVAMLLAWQRVRRYQRNQYRRDALAQLAQLEASAAVNPNAVAAALSTLLKQTALAAYPRAEVAALYGEDWAEFLRTSSAQDPQVAEFATSLAYAAYRRDVDGAELIEPTRRWIMTHHA